MIEFKNLFMLKLGFLLMFNFFLILLIIPNISFSSVTFKNGRGSVVIKAMVGPLLKIMN